MLRRSFLPPSTIAHWEACLFDHIILIIIIIVVLGVRPSVHIFLIFFDSFRTFCTHSVHSKNWKEKMYTCPCLYTNKQQKRILEFLSLRRERKYKSLKIIVINLSKKNKKDESGLLELNRNSLREIISEGSMDPTSILCP
mgnify:CR=1 FL=1